MKKYTLTALIIATLISGFLLVCLENSDAAISSSGPRQTDTAQGAGPISAPFAVALNTNEQAGGNGNNGNGERNSNDANNGNRPTVGGNNNGNGNGQGSAPNGRNGGNNANGNGNSSDNEDSRGNNGNNGNSGNNDGSNNVNGGNGNGNNGNGNNGNGNNGNGDDNGSGNNGNGDDNSDKQDPTKFKISGYILDATGKGLGGAMIIFNVPHIVPAVYSDYTGYYEMYAPAGTYHINVWPPFDSNCIYFDQPGFTVGADTAKNITLQEGVKVSGYIRDSSGAPVSGAVVCLNNLLSGWFSNYAGYYFVSVPAGTYKLDAHPRIGTYASPTPSFPTYYEYNFAVRCDTVKNITVGNSSANPNPTRSAVISLSVDANSRIGATLLAAGKLSEHNGTPIANKTVIMSYSVADCNVWTQIGSSKTDASGSYSIEWLVPASGTFTLKVEWAGNSDYALVSTTKTLTFEPGFSAI